MAYKDKEKERATHRAWQKKNRAKQTRWTAEWKAKNPERYRQVQRLSDRKYMGEPGSAKREAYNERRRIRAKQACLAETAAIREAKEKLVKHKESLHEFIRRRAA